MADSSRHVELFKLPLSHVIHVAKYLTQLIMSAGVDDLQKEKCKLGVYHAEKGERGMLSLQVCMHSWSTGPQQWEQLPVSPDCKHEFVVHSEPFSINSTASLHSLHT